jgi:AcrR family transcriptional regulator
LFRHRVETRSHFRQVVKSVLRSTSLVGSPTIYAAPIAKAPPQQKRTYLSGPVRREQILQAAIDAFSERGYGASMDDVADAAGVTRTVLYYYYPSKKDLFAAVHQAQQAEMLTYVAPAVAGPGSQQERARVAIDAALSFAERHPKSWKLLSGDLEGAGPELIEAIRGAHEVSMEAIEALLAPDAAERGIKQGSVRGRILAESFLGSMTAIWRWWAEHPHVPREEVGDALYEVLWHGLEGLGGDRAR